MSRFLVRLPNRRVACVDPNAPHWDSFVSGAQPARMLTWEKEEDAERFAARYGGSAEEVPRYTGNPMPVFSETARREWLDERRRQRHDQD